MSSSRDPLSLEFLGALIRSVQSEQRSLRVELHHLVDRIDRLERSISDRIAATNDRIAGVEARIDTRFDQMQSEMVRTLDEILKTLQGGADKA